MFIQGHSYRRSELHDRYGGQRQGGISTPLQHPIIMLFSGESGEQHGYADTWSAEGLFLYTGEGQEGHMAFVRGNAAIRDHIDNGKDLHLFLQVKKGYVRYIGQMVCTGHHYQAGRDTLGRPRRMIIFELTPLDVLTEADQFTAELLADPEPQMSLADLRAKALADSSAARDAIERQAVYRQRSQWIKQYALQRAHGTCEGCGVPAPFKSRDGRLYLEVHHIRRLSDGGPDDPRWVVAICPNCHRRAHYAEDAETYNTYLSQIAEELERPAES